MAVASKYVTRKEFEPVKTGVDHLTIRMEVITYDLHSLRMQVADLADNVDVRFERLEERMDRLEERMGRLEERMDRLEKTVVDGNAAIMSALLKMAPRS
jgi:predicted nuclease with TOPRIM domain